jgi:hypothetical protein
MNGPDAQPTQAPAYALVPARSIADDRLLAFAASVLPESPPERMLQSWWRGADPSCAVAAMHEATGEMAGLCAGRPSKWSIDGVSYPAIAICGWYVAPGHVGRLIGRRLVRHFEAPDRMMYAYSMSEDASQYLSRLGWVGPYSSSLLALPLPWAARLAHAILRQNPDLTLVDHVVDAQMLPEELGAKLDRIEARLAPGVPAHMRRGSEEWSWRLGVSGARRYLFCVAAISGEPAGYVAVRRMTPGSSRMLGKRTGAIVTDLVIIDDDPALMRALIARAVSFTAELRAPVLLASTTVAGHRRGYTALGFLSSSMPVLGRSLQRRAPQFMWRPQGPAAALTADTITLSFSDSDVDLNL